MDGRPGGHDERGIGDAMHLEGAVRMVALNRHNVDGDVRPLNRTAPPQRGVTGRSFAVAPIMPGPPPIMPWPEPVIPCANTAGAARPAMDTIKELHFRNVAIFIFVLRGKPRQADGPNAASRRGFWLAKVP